jgi:hypothetical protein
LGEGPVELKGKGKEGEDDRGDEYNQSVLYI